jgi:DNA-binding HxlR family transcriptional regulator
LQSLTLESEFRRTHKNLETKYKNQSVTYINCPVEASLGVLGKKWTIVIIRDIGVYGRDRFNLLLKSLAGIPPKVLATRLKELEQGGFAKRIVEKRVPPMVVRWSLTEKGMDAIRIGMMLAAFGSKWSADTVFEDKKPRKMREIFNSEGMELLTKDF